MPQTGLQVFDSTLQKTNEILSQIEEDLNWQGRRHQSYQALRIVLHTLRDRLPLELNLHLAAELPLLLKGVYFDGFNPAKSPVRLSADDFIECVGSQLNFSSKGSSVKKIIRISLTAIFDHINPNEMLNIIDSLPREFQDLMY